ncbi:MAG: hypothetical protein AB2801_08585 [Candidatus Thiodiazotropha endolucinida]
MKVRATKNGVYKGVMRTPESGPFDFEAKDKKKTSEVVKKSSWLEPVEEQKPAKAPPATPPAEVQQPASTQAAPAKKQQPKAPAKAPANNQDKKPDGDSNDKSQAE